MGGSTDPRTAEGLERLQAAGTTHGRRTAEMERMRAMVRVLMPMMAWTQHSCHQAQSSAIRPARSASSQDRWRWRRRARPLARTRPITGRVVMRERFGHGTARLDVLCLAPNQGDPDVRAGRFGAVFGAHARKPD